MPPRTYVVHMETTVPDLRAARKMIKTILDEGLAASAWLSEIRSFQSNDGKGTRRRFVAFKTSPEGRRRLQARMLQLHPENNPYLGWIRPHEAPSEYLGWVRRKTTAPAVGRRRQSARR